MTTTRAAIYARVSTDEQVDGTSLTEQLRRCSARIESEGWTLAGEYVDEGVSGAKALSDRPNGRRLLADIEAGKVDAVVVLKVDRLTRSLVHGSEVLANWSVEVAGEPTVAFVSVGEDFNTVTPTGRMMLNLLMVFAEFERDRIAERTASGRLATAEAGRWPGGQLPLGYVLDDDGRIIEDTEYVSTVRRIFAARVAGHPLTDIADALNRDGLRMRPKGDKPGGPFTVGNLGYIVKHPAYLGGPASLTSKVDGRDFTFEAPALVEADVWKAAQAQRQGRRRNRQTAAKRDTGYALARRIVHGDDHGHPQGRTPTMFIQNRKVKGGKLRTYRCLWTRDVDAVSAGLEGAYCPGVGRYGNTKGTAISADLIEARVGLWAISLICDPKALEEYARNADRALLAEGEDPEDLAAQRRRLAARKATREKYVDMYAEGFIDRAALDERLAKVDAEVEVLEAAIARASDIEAEREVLGASIAELMAMTVDPTNTDRDPNADEPPTLAEELEQLKVQCWRTIKHEHRQNGRPARLSDWAIGKICWLVSMLGQPEPPWIRGSVAGCVLTVLGRWLA
jgi:DNA invertase Pin-like site-specific DNA recombinase